MRVQVTKFEANTEPNRGTGEIEAGGVAQCVTESGDVAVLEIREAAAKVIRGAGSFLLKLAPRVVNVAYTRKDGKPGSFGRTVFVVVGAEPAQAK
jgi:hypothetical protein